MNWPHTFLTGKVIFTLHKGKVVTLFEHHIMNKNLGVEAKFHAFLTLALNEGG
jgi:hypothetical protein